MDITSARKLVGQQIGLPQSFDGSISAYSLLSQDEQTQLTKNLINYIVANPGDFTPGQVTTAQAQYGQAQNLGVSDPNSVLADTEIFFSELENQAQIKILQPLATIGNGVANSVSIVGNLIPVAVLVVVVIFAWPYIRKAFAK